MLATTIEGYSRQWCQVDCSSQLTISAFFRHVIVPSTVSVALAMLVPEAQGKVVFLGLRS